MPIKKNNQFCTHKANLYMELLHKYRQTDKMVTLITDNYALLQVMSRFGIKIGFGDKTVEEVCQEKEEVEVEEAGKEVMKDIGKEIWSIDIQRILVCILLLLFLYIHLFIVCLNNLLIKNYIVFE